jgi:hypothetical protein
MNTVEKVARAIETAFQCEKCEALVSVNSVTLDCGCVYPIWRAASPHNQARAALTALREPSEGMVEAMHRTYERHGQSGGLRASRLSDDQLRATYQAAIDQALSEGEG